MRGEEAVEPLPGALAGTVSSPADTRRSLIGAAPTSACDVEVALRAPRPASAATSVASRIATPRTMNVSARLNAGHHDEVDEVRHVAETHPVGEVRDAAADQQAERSRHHRVSGAGAREEDSIQTTAIAVARS